MYSSAVNVTYINIFYNKKEVNEKTHRWFSCSFFSLKLIVYSYYYILTSVNFMFIFHLV